MTLDIRRFLQPRTINTAQQAAELNQDGDASEPQPLFVTAHEELTSTIKALQSLPDSASNNHRPILWWRDPCLYVFRRTLATSMHTITHHSTPTLQSIATLQSYWPRLTPRLAISLATLPPTYPSPPPVTRDPAVLRTVFDPRGELLIAATAYGAISLWDVALLRHAAHSSAADSTPLLCLHSGQRLSHAAWNPVQDTHIAVASHSCRDVRLYDLERCTVRAVDAIDGRHHHTWPYTERANVGVAQPPGWCSKLDAFQQHGALYTCCHGRRCCRAGTCGSTLYIGWSRCMCMYANHVHATGSSCC